MGKSTTDSDSEVLVCGKKIMKQMKVRLARRNTFNGEVLMNPVKFFSSEYLCVYITRSMYLF